MAKKDKAEEPSEYSKLHNRSLREIASDSARKSRKEVEEKEEKPKPKEPESEDKPLQVKEEPLEVKVDDEKAKNERLEKRKQEREEKAKQDEARIAELAKKTAEETAAKVAAENKATFETEVNKILEDKEKSRIQKQEELDAMIPVWEKEKRLPKDWRETTAELDRIAEVKLNKRLREIEESKQLETKTNEEKAAKEREEIAIRQAQQQDQNVQQVTRDLDYLFASKSLKRVTMDEINNSDTSDENAKEVQKLLKFGIELNTKLRNEGKEPIPSVFKIYHDHYKPYLDAHPDKKNDQPAGADAPISGANNTPTAASNEDKFVYARDHNKGIRQIGADILKRVRRPS